MAYSCGIADENRADDDHFAIVESGELAFGSQAFTICTVPDKDMPRAKVQNGLPLKSLLIG